MASVVTYSKLQAAEVQLRTAIALFFSRADPIPIETLCGAAIGILRALGKKYNVISPIHDSDWIKDEYKSYWIGRLHEAQNFSKHADKDLDAVLRYDPSVIPLRIAEAAYLYKMLSYPTRMNYKVKNWIIVWDLWFSFKYPNMIKKDNLSWAKILEDFKMVDPDPDNYEFFLELVRRQDT